MYNFFEENKHDSKLSTIFFYHENKIRKLISKIKLWIHLVQIPPHPVSFVNTYQILIIYWKRKW